MKAERGRVIRQSSLLRTALGEAKTLLQNKLCLGMLQEFMAPIGKGYLLDRAASRKFLCTCIISQ